MNRLDKRATWEKEALPNGTWCWQLRLVCLVARIKPLPNGYFDCSIDGPYVGLPPEAHESIEFAKGRTEQRLLQVADRIFREAVSLFENPPTDMMVGIIADMAKILRR